MAVARLELHIEELVLHGFAPGDRAGIGDAVQAELGRLLAQAGAPPTTAVSVARLDAGSFRVAPGAAAETIGTQVGGRVHQSLAARPPRAVRRGAK